MLMCYEFCWEASSDWEQRDVTRREMEQEAEGKAMVGQEEGKQDNNNSLNHLKLLSN